jgi:hypothetical protein
VINEALRYSRLRFAVVNELFEARLALPNGSFLTGLCIGVLIRRKRYVLGLDKN